MPTQKTDEPDGKVYAQYTQSTRRHRPPDRVWEEPETVEEVDYLRKVTEDEKQAIRREAEMERQLGQAEPTYIADVLRAYNGLRAGDRAGFAKSKAEDLIDADVLSDDFEVIRPEETIDAEDPEVTEATRRKELESADYTSLKSDAAAINDVVEDDPKSQTRDDLVEFVLDHWTKYTALEGE